MLNKKIKKALKIILKRLENKRISWVVGGGTNLVLQGINVKPRDIDIFTTKEGAFKIYKCLEKYGVQKITYGESPSGRTRSWFGKLKIGTVDVDINGNPKYKDKAKNKWIKSKVLFVKEHIKINNQDVPVVPLWYELQVLKATQKDVEKIRKLRKFLKKYEKKAG